MSTAAAWTLRAELARKALHLGTAALPIAWAFDVVDAAQLRLALTAAVAVALSIEALRARSPRAAELFRSSVGAMLRRHESTRLTGATWLALAMAGVVWLAPPPAALAALWAAAVGDATAALAGLSLASWRGVAPDGRKSLAGSLAALLSTALGCLWLVAASWPVALTLGVVAALAEWPRRPLDDNLRVAVAVALAAVALGLR